MAGYKDLHGLRGRWEMDLERQIGKDRLGIVTRQKGIDSSWVERWMNGEAE